MRTAVIVCALALLAGCGKSKAEKPKKPKKKTAQKAAAPARAKSQPLAPFGRSDQCSSLQQDAWNKCAAAVLLVGKKKGMGLVNIGSLCNGFSLRTAKGGYLSSEKVRSHLLSKAGVLITDLFTLRLKKNYSDSDYRLWTCAVSDTGKGLKILSVRIRRLKKGEL